MNTLFTNKFKSLTYMNPLFYVFVLPLVADATFTIMGQGKDYWENHTLVNEASPVYIILQTSPLLFIIGSILWIAFMYWLVLKLKSPYDLFLTLLILIGDTWGSSTWLRHILADKVYTVPTRIEIIVAWCIMVLYFSIITTIATRFIFLYFAKKIEMTNPNLLNKNGMLYIQTLGNIKLLKT